MKEEKIDQIYISYKKKKLIEDKKMNDEK